jgi:hypothetical protein
MHGPKIHSCIQPCIVALITLRALKMFFCAYVDTSRKGINVHSQGGVTCADTCVRYITINAVPCNVTVKIT